MPAPVTFDARDDAGLRSVADRAEAAGDDISAALALTRALDSTPMPGGGSTAARFEVLATLGAADLTSARVAEPHLDALAILDEAAFAGFDLDLAAAGVDASASWGVFAAEGPGVRLAADEVNGEWVLSGTKPWCSLADSLSAALITAHTPAGRRLFAVDLRHDGVTVQPGTWHARGLSTVRSGPVDFDTVPAVPVGTAGWYLERPGFAWGGVGVAAVWWGGAIGLARALHGRARTAADQPILTMHLGAVDAALSAAGETLHAAARAIDAGKDTSLVAARARVVVHDAAELVLQRVGHALGPAPMALDERHARRVADLTLYLRQHHAERDEAALGALLAQQHEPPW